ncbi:MAG: MaoC family dehydratase [Micrococcales bacterium]|nr:MaoC family dehydratase [Micrococcales bacterium]
MSGIQVRSFDEIEGAVGESATGEWLSVDQRRIDDFADATSDHQWIHVDPARAAAGPFGTTVAHGFLLLSLIPELTSRMWDVPDVLFVVNYGLDRVRFVSAVPVDSRIRAVSTVRDVTRTPMGARVSVEVVLEREGAGKPAVVAETIVLFVPA